MARRTGYSALQIGLHWLVALMIVAAYTTRDGMGRALDARLESGAMGPAGNRVHVWLGGAVFGFVLLRVVVRSLSGSPGATPSAWYLHVAAASGAHELAATLLVLLALAHAVAAIAHEARFGDGTIGRMMRPGG